MAHKTEGDCPVATGIFIRKQADKQGLSVREMIKQYACEVELPESTVSKWVWPKKDGATKNGSSSNQPKTQTKPETKIQISEIANEIKSGAVSDDHAKIIGDALAEAIDKDICAKRVVSKVVTAVKKKNNERREVKIQEPDNYQRLWKNILAASEGLQLMADGSIPQPQTEEEAEAVKGIMAGLPFLCLQIARMGVDLVDIHETFFKGDRNETKYIDIEEN